jgi:predicted alpha-1,6-mannanase (GH76 family)
MTPAVGATWSARADVAQVSLDHFFGTGEPQLLNNTYPSERRDNKTFNYWWLAHVIDVRLDAYERSGDRKWVEAAEAAYRNILARNGGSFFNDFFDDMLWCGLAVLRLHDATGDSRYLDDAEAIWAHVVEFGCNDEQGYSVAWRKQQLDYKNTPSNGTFVILSCRLAQHIADPQYIEYAQSAYDWLTNNQVDRDSGFVADGINRKRDGQVDTQWRFTYNQGLYVGAAVELGISQATATSCSRSLARL